MMSENKEENKYLAIISKCHEVVSAISCKTNFISIGDSFATSIDTPKRAVILEQELEELLAHLQTVHDGIQV